MGVLDVTIQPGIADLALVYLSCRQVSLRKISIDRVPVYVHIVELVVLSDTLSLIIERLNRRIVINPDI